VKTGAKKHEPGRAGGRPGKAERQRSKSVLSCQRAVPEGLPMIYDRPRVEGKHRRGAAPSTSDEMTSWGKRSRNGRRFKLTKLVRRTEGLRSIEEKKCQGKLWNE